MTALTRTFVAAMLLSSLTAVTGVPPRPVEDCDPKFWTENKSFRKIATSKPAWKDALRNTFVWVDDIKSKLFGGFNPFEIRIVTGLYYAPFGTDTGPLSKNGFDELFTRKKDPNIALYNKFPKIDRKPPQKAERIPPLPDLEFRVSDSFFYLKITDLDIDYLGSDRVQLQLCKK